MLETVNETFETGAARHRSNAAWMDHMSNEEWEMSWYGGARPPDCHIGP